MKHFGGQRVSILLRTRIANNVRDFLQTFQGIMHDKYMEAKLFFLMWMEIILYLSN